VIAELITWAVTLRGFSRSVPAVVSTFIAPAISDGPAVISTLMRLA
jgi:hypothetical protein